MGRDILQELRIANRIASHIGQRWLRGYVRGKILLDPVYDASFTLLCDTVYPIYDIGCGIGMHAFYLRERGLEQPIIGVDVDPIKIADGLPCAAAYRDISLEVQCADGSLEFPSANITILDVIHYLTPADRERLLHRIAAALPENAWCIMRVTLKDDSIRYKLTLAEERFARAVRWMRHDASGFPVLEEFAPPFPAHSFERHIRPLWGLTPFNSYLLAFRRKAGNV